MNSTATYLPYIGVAAQYSAMTSAGFLVSVVLAWAILACSKPGSRPIGSFGKFMVALEAVDAFPEAMVIAEASAGHRPPLL